MSRDKRPDSVLIEVRRSEKTRLNLNSDCGSNQLQLINTMLITQSEDWRGEGALAAGDGCN